MWDTTLPTAPHLCPCRDTDIYDDVEIYGRCTELLPYTFTDHSDHHTKHQDSPPPDPLLFCCLPSLSSLCVIPLHLPEVSFTYSQFPKSLRVPLFPVIWASVHPVLSLLPLLAASPRAPSMSFEVSLIHQTTQTSLSQAVVLS